MTKTIHMTIFGIEFEVEVEYEDNAVCGVLSVKCGGAPIKCNLNEFCRDCEDDLQRALIDTLEDERIAYAEMRYEAAKEEGLLHEENFKD